MKILPLKKLLVITTIFFAATNLSACALLAAAGIYKAGTTLAEERTTGQVIDDAKINAEISHYFLQKDVDDLFANVDISINQGRVLLTGVVDEPETKVDAAVLAWQAKGVTEVLNEIQVANTRKIKDYGKDQAIIAQLRGKLLLEKNVKSVNYTIDAINGVVYLMGIAQNQQELKKVTFIASKIKGVKKVISHVKVETAATPVKTEQVIEKAL